MATLERDATFGMLNRKKAQSISDDAIALLNIRVPHSQVRAGGLSGGNQQKLLISRWVAIGPRILILDEPTRGVDVGAKSEIYRIMNQMARKGVAILMISSELPEVVGMSDRVYVMREGSIAGELHGRDISQENIMTLAMAWTTHIIRRCNYDNSNPSAAGGEICLRQKNADERSDANGRHFTYFNSDRGGIWLYRP